jgi:dihydrofolate reductase
MSKVIADITMSLDGYVTPPSGDVDELHTWVVEQDAVDSDILERELGMQFTFVDGLMAAVEQARIAATDGHVVIMGGGDVIGQALEMGLVDELHLHLAPMLLGGGTPLFRSGTRQTYRQRDVSESSHAVHLTYERL